MGSKVSWRLPAVLLTGVVVIAAATGWLYSRQSLFRLSEVEVRSEDSDVSEAARRLCARWLGRGLFAISLRDVEHVVSQLPAISSVAIHRRWPSRLLIELRLRRPVAFGFHDGTLWTLDSEGGRIAPVTRPLVLPLLRSLPDENSLRREALAWIAAQGGGDTDSLDFALIDAIRWNPESGLEVRMESVELDVSLGFSGFVDAWTRADKAFAALRSRGQRAKFLDASYRQRVVAQLHGDLRNPGSGLNLRELVRRANPETTSEPPRAR